MSRKKQLQLKLVKLEFEIKEIKEELEKIENSNQEKTKKYDIVNDYIDNLFKEKQPWMEK